MCKRVYEEYDEEWTQIGTITVVDSEINSVVMSGDGKRFVAGTMGDYFNGAAFIFELDGFDWVNVGRIDGNGIDVHYFSTFGVGLSYDGTRLIGGSALLTSVPGLTRTYEGQGSSEWSQIGKLKSSKER